MWLTLLIGGFGLSALLVLAALRYSRARGLVDSPGARRSHASDTPRAGGIGIVIAYLCVLTMLAWLGLVPALIAWGLTVALILVAGIGYLDDHQPQKVGRRLLVHAFAAVVLTASLLGASQEGWSWLTALIGVATLMVAINFSNFMDGSNGMLCIQTMAIAALLMLLAIMAGNVALALLAALLVATTSGFLPFNFPQAQIFLGDVGSGALGMLLAALGLHAFVAGSVNGWLLLALCSALWLDAGLTLLLRMLTDRRWTTPHRSHLYQWLLRRGWSHAQVAFLYLAWTLLFVLPIILLSTAGWLPELAALAIVLGGGVAAWLAGRLTLRRQARRHPSQLSMHANRPPRSLT